MAVSPLSGLTRHHYIFEGDIGSEVQRIWRLVRIIFVSFILARSSFQWTAYVRFHFGRGLSEAKFCASPVTAVGLTGVLSLSQDSF
jgi:hypothetical protein